MIPVLLRYKLSLPFSCPFHHERDILWWPNVQLDFVDDEWICPFCGAAFSSEEVVMEHWDKNHVHFQVYCFTYLLLTICTPEEICHQYFSKIFSLLICKNQCITNLYSKIIFQLLD